MKNIIYFLFYINNFFFKTKLNAKATLKFLFYLNKKIKYFN